MIGPQQLNWQGTETNNDATVPGWPPAAGNQESSDQSPGRTGRRNTTSGDNAGGTTG